jgi:TonB family protein
MNTLRIAQRLSTIGAAALAGFSAPASAQQTSEETFVDLGRWVIVQDEAARACELRLTNDPRYVLRYRMSDGRAGLMSIQRRSGRFFTGMVGDVEWAFDDVRFAGFQSGDGYSLGAGARDVEAGFRTAKTLSVIHAGQLVADIDLKASSAGFRLLKQCSEQWRYIPWYRRLASARVRDLDAPSARAVPPAPTRSQPVVRESSIAPPLDQPTLTTPLKPRPINPASWISSNDELPWPSRGFRSGQGVLRYTLLVDEEGRAQDCEVEASTGSRKFDRRACKLLVERARFEPARGANGEAVEARFSASMRFEGE